MDLKKIREAAESISKDVCRCKFCDEKNSDKAIVADAVPNLLEEIDRLTTRAEAAEDHVKILAGRAT